METREGYRVICWQLPAVLLDRLEAEANAAGVKYAAFLTRLLCERYEVDPESLPKRQRPGPEKGAKKKAPPKPKKGRKKT